MISVYSGTRRQQHLEGKCSSQLRHLQAGVIKNLEEPILSRWPATYKMMDSGLLRKLPGVDFFAAEAHFHDPATQTFIVSVKHGKIITDHQIQMNMRILKCLQHMSLHMNP